MAHDSRPRKVGTLSIQYTKTGFVVWETAVFPNVQVYKQRIKSRPGSDMVGAQNSLARLFLGSIGMGI